MALSIEYIALDELKHYEKNARTHSHEQVEQLVNSINEFGFTNPVLIDEGNVLIAGHGRTAAASLAGLTDVPAVRLVGLSDEQKIALRIADNQLALNAGWDLSLLADEVQSLEVEGFDISVIGFSDEFLENLLSVDDEGESEEVGNHQDKSDFTNKVFILHEKQVGVVDEAIELARIDPLADVGINENANGNALALICKEWLQTRRRG